MKNILVPIDFSEHSNYAVEVAVDLAKKNGATILTLCRITKTFCY